MTAPDDNSAANSSPPAEQSPVLFRGLLLVVSLSSLVLALYVITWFGFFFVTCRLFGEKDDFSIYLAGTGLFLLWVAWWLFPFRRRWRQANAGEQARPGPVPRR